VYNTLYLEFPSKEESIEKLGLPSHQYAISLGAFRNDEEKKLFFKIADGFRKYGIYCIAPSLMLDIPHGKINKRWIKQRVKLIILKLMHPNAIFNIGYVSDELIPYYFALSDFSIIQRLDILNSGNVPLGMYFANVVLGPNVGNVGEILKETGNPCFDVEDLNTINKVCGDAMKAKMNDIGERNREYVIKNWNTEDVAEMVYQLYKSLV
jgi:glycosyltransferase involved in cell wall biosynthesis